MKKLPKWILAGVVLNRKRDKFYCWQHRNWFSVEKLLVCDIRGCKWCKECYAELQNYKRRQKREAEDARRRIAGLGAAG